MLTAIIVAAGSSARMGFDKTFVSLGGIPAVGHSLHAFERAASVTDIILVGREDRIGELNEIVRTQKIKKVRQVIAGGAHRQDSVRIGLNFLNSNARYVAVHDAARPLITAEQIERVFSKCRLHNAAALAEPITDTLKRADKEYFVSGAVNREGIYAMQTPQIFSRELLVRAYEAIAKTNLSITDEVSAVENLGEKVVLVPNEEANLKITYPRDLEIAEAVLIRRAAG